MKISELMVNDWFMWKYVPCKPKFLADEHKPRTVDITSRIESMSELLALENEMSEDTQDIQPIPLTDEFFEANGFKYDKACLYWYKEIEKETWLTICVWFNKLYKIEIIRGQYSYDGTHEKEVCVNTEPHIHLLQHALRLCGLNDLADNFKVE